MKNLNWSTWRNGRGGGGDRMLIMVLIYILIGCAADSCSLFSNFCPFFVDGSVTVARITFDRFLFEQILFATYKLTVQGSSMKHNLMKQTQTEGL